MLPLVVFTKEEELTELTGLSYQELRENGFDLGDWDRGMQIMQCIHEHKYYDCNDDECLLDSNKFCYMETVWKDGYEKFFRKLNSQELLECTEYDELRFRD
ncbi:hypothetical protein M2454_001126 [Aequitasia blattaphilus]|uniref:Uncharacterized protein n=1 Tax=Aequitasia blattaphilus TaxID=2949332 RepID=A0ABT1E947_9FIRM|nr:hypothetical protein [Aequitasia blattaphilus]MCP1101391.1 hypothetical protein [Aequitasia blattaphilus]MCR8614031.1 hypothetical protein [Aequitasia blattaphilus]